MGVDLTAAWCEIEGLADSLAPLIHEVLGLLVVLDLFSGLQWTGI